MATRMQQRRGTAAQWISTNSGNGPILNAGEIGYETDTNKFKIGDGTNHWVNLDYFVDANSTANPSFGTSITFEGATADSYETTLQVTDPTADRTITFPDATGTVALTSDIAELSQDAIDTALTAGTGITKTYNDGANTLTLAVDTTAIQARVTDVSDTEIGYLNGVTSAIQTQLDAKLASATASTTYAPLASPTFTGTVTLPSGTVTSTMILDGTIATADIADSAVTSAKIADGTIVAGDIADGAITTAKILDGTIATGDIADSAITSAKIANDTIVDADINSAAAIAQSKISGLTTDLAGKAPLAAPAFTGTATAVNLTISGDLTVNGTTTNLNSTSLVVEDKNVILGDTATPTDTTADGGGITLKGTTDKTFNWVDATDAWTSSEDMNLLTGKVYEINGTTVLSGSTLGSGVTGSSLTSVGTIATGTWSASTIALNKGGTGATTQAGAANAVLPAQTSASGKYLTSDGTNVSWGTVSSYSAPTLGSTSVASGATVTTIAGLTLSGATLTGTLTANSSAGTSGQVLSSTGSGVQWITPAAGAAFSELMLIGA